MTYIPIHVHTCWSLLDSTVDIEKLAKKAKEYGLPAVCLTDHHNIKGVVIFVNEMTKVGIKPIIGCELNIWDKKTDEVSRLTVLCKNKTGYKNLVQILYASNKKENLDKELQPRIALEDITGLRSGLIALAGDIQSNISDERVLVYQKLFEHFFLFADTLHKESSDKHIENNFNVRDIGERLNIPVLPCNNIHYLDEEDRGIHEVVLRSSIDSIKQLDQNLYEYRDYSLFKGTSQSYLTKTIGGGKKTLVLLDLIEDFSIKERPILPRYKTGEHYISDPDEFLYKLCRQGFKERGLLKELRLDKPLFKVYGDRAKEELALFKSIGLSSYFLIVLDIINFCKKKGIPVDVRGSSTACLINYLIGVSSVDPLRPDPSLAYTKERELDLGRFYNEGRNTKDHISLMDIDIDVPPFMRQPIISYLKETYGKDCVAHIITHSRFKGKGAIKEVFRLADIPNYFEISDGITKKMTDESKISDELAEMQEDDSDYGIIQWNIDNIKDIKDAYEEYKDIFEKAIALEKIPRNASVHAAGLIVSDRSLGTLFPMVYSEKLGEHVVGIEGKEVEELGALKLDLLGVHMMEKIHVIEGMINNKLQEAYTR